MKEREEDLVEMESEDSQAPLAPKENLVCKAFLEFLVKKEIEDIKVMRDPKEMKDLKG